MNLNLKTFLEDYRICPLPHYIILTCVLTFLPLVIFLRLSVLLKAALIIPMAAVFLMVIEFTHFQVFACYDLRVGYVYSYSLLFLFIF